MRHPLLTAAALSVCFTGAASAQSIYIDFGTVTGTPSSAFGGASGAPGVWNAHDGEEGTVGTLMDIGGVTTGVSLTLSAEGSTGVNDVDIGLTGDNAALLQDLVFGTFNDLTLEFAGLSPGEYRIVTYAIGRQQHISSTDVWIQGDTSTTQEISAEWNGSFALGETHSEHTIDLSDGLLRIDLLKSGDAVVNGVQVILVPTPGAGALLLMAGLAALRRRTR